MSSVIACELPPPLPGNGSGPDLGRYQDAGTIRRLLTSARTVAVVGLSPKELRASYFVGFYLQRNGYRVVPVNPREQEILGEKCYPSVAAIEEPVDIVNVFRAPAAVPASSRSAPAARRRSGCNTESSTRKRPNGPANSESRWSWTAA